MTTTAVRLPDDLYQQLEEVARARKRPKGAILREALEAYLELRADYEIAVERMKDPTDPVLTEAEFLAELGWKL